MALPVAEQLIEAQQKIARLEAEIDTLKNTPTPSMPDVTAQTVGLLSRAQAIADQNIADAELFAQDLIDSARKQYNEILQKAHDRAREISGEAVASQPTEPAAPALPAYTTPVEDIEYVRTYTKVAQVQLRAVIDALVEQVDKLGATPDFINPVGGATQK